MKIKNVEKFRNELLKAIEDVYYVNAEWCECIWKDGNEYTGMMKEVSTWEEIDGEWKCVSLPKAIKINGAKLAITVDSDGDIELWSTSVKTHFVRLVTIPAKIRANKLAIAMEVSVMIEKYWNWM